MSDLVSSAVGLALPVIAQVASVPDDRSAAIWWLIGLAAVAVAFNQISNAWLRITGRFQEKRGDTPDYQTRPRCEELHREITRTLIDMNAAHNTRTETLRREIKDDVGNIYDRIESKTQATTDRITELVRVIGDLSGQIKRLANGRSSHAQ